MSGFEDDIRAQGSVFRSIIEAYRHGLPGDAESVVRRVAHDQPIMLTGMGGSLAAAEFIVPVLRAAGRQAIAVDASELALGTWRAFPPTTLVIAVSQSGRSRETVAAVETLKNAGFSNLVALVNDSKSPLARLVAHSLPMLAGEELRASAKSFTASQFVLNMLCKAIVSCGAISGENPRIGPEEHRMADILDRLSFRTEHAERAASLLWHAPYLAVLARGAAMSTAKYGALLLKESAAHPAEAITIGEFAHGPVELTTIPIGIVLISPDPSHSGSDVALADRLSTRGTPVWLLTTQQEASLPVTRSFFATEIPKLRMPLGAIACCIELQLFVTAITRLRGREPGVFTTFQRADTEVSVGQRSPLPHE